jgi:hypothetical protein
MLRDSLLSDRFIGHSIIPLFFPQNILVTEETVGRYIQNFSLFIFNCDILPYIRWRPSTVVNSPKNKLGSISVVVHSKVVSKLRESEEEYVNTVSESPRTGLVIEPRTSRI